MRWSGRQPWKLKIPVSPHPSRHAVPSAQQFADKVFTALERFLHVEAVSGIVLLLAAAAALIWANSPVAESYQHLWHAPFSIGIGGYVISQPLHFWINDGLMTIFFLVVGMEIRREMYEGALASLQLAALPLAAAIGGVAVPALIYLGMNWDPTLRQGWAIPTATDIAFAVGVLALLGKSIPAAVRILLLALAIIDDIAAVIIIAVFYSGGLDFLGLLVAGIGLLIVIGFQRIGIGSAYAYVIPGAIVWFGLLMTGAHPTLAGVALGLMTPVLCRPRREAPVDAAARALSSVSEQIQTKHVDPRALVEPLKELRNAQRELLPPVVRVQMALHPWVAYGVMPLFALANAGVTLDASMFTGAGFQTVTFGIFLALVVGKPVGIFLGSWLAVSAGWCRLPPGVHWNSVLLVGCLGGIGFTMSIFIASLAFSDQSLLSAAKAGVMLASLVAGILGLVLGRILSMRRANEPPIEDGSPVKSRAIDQHG
jgi:Na+:H+ antiporter, NhaA family